MSNINDEINNISDINELRERLRHTEWKLALSEATSRNYSMRDIVAACAKIADGAAFFLNKNFRVSYMGGTSCLESKAASKLLTDGYISAKETKEHLESISEGKILKRKEENGDYTWAVKVSLSDTEPFYIILFTYNDVPKGDIELLFSLLKESFGAINLHRKHGDVPIGDFSAFMNGIIDGTLSNWDEIDAYAKRLPDPPKRFITIGTVEANPSMRRTSMNALASKLKTFFPGCSAAQVGDFIILMISSDSRINQPRPRFNTEAMESILNEYDAYIAFSNATQRFDMVRTTYILAESTLKLGRALREQGVSRIFYYEDYAEYISIEMSLEHFRNIMGHDDILFLTSPDAVDIYRYDQQHGTDLLLVLYHYCKNSGNISAAAKDAYMHRNTFATRMAQIKEILKKVDLSDGRVQQRLLTSCRVFRYYNFYYDKKAAKSLSERLSVTQSE